MKKIYLVDLSKEERGFLEAIVNKGQELAYKRRRAQILLKADQGALGPAWNDQQISKAFDITVGTVEILRKNFASKRLEALNRKKGSGKQRTLDAEQEARLITLACSEPPEGSARWSLRLLANKVVELAIVESISYESIRGTLKKIS